jgi:predicted DNA-binding mobile mystery protein A
MSSYWDKKLMREQLDKKLSSFRDLLSVLPENVGWIKQLREALSMSTKQLGKRVGLDQSRISRLEKAEINGDMKLSSLQKIARGLNMKFVYGFVPETTMDDIMLQQARKIALKRQKKVDHTMRLEEQEIPIEDKEKALQTLTEKILIEQPKDFWDQ